MSAVSGNWGYTAEDVAKIVHLPLSAIRELVDDGCLHPTRQGGEERFTFQDLVVLRAAQKLREARVPRRRIRSALRGLEESLPRGTSMTALRIAAHGGTVVVHDGEKVWNPESGQVLFDFAVADLVREVAPVARRRAAAVWEHRDELDAEGWYQLGCELELGGSEGCLDAYRRALECAPTHFDANLNLGHCLHERGKLEEAARLYRRAMDTRPTEALAAFNLGVVMEDLGRPEDAIGAYESALAVDADCADAHYNVARLYEARGETAEAVRHLTSYRRLSRQG